MRITLYNVEIDDMPDTYSVCADIQENDYRDCIYALKNGSVFYAKKTKTGYSIHKEPST